MTIDGTKLLKVEGVKTFGLSFPVGRSLYGSRSCLWFPRGT